MPSERPRGPAAPSSARGARRRSAPAAGPSPARAAAYAVLRRTFEQGAFTDRAFHAAARDLGPRDRALAMHLAYGAVQRARTLDHLVEVVSGRSAAAIDAPLLAALRLGAYELCFAGSAAHAAVNDAVELAKPAHGLTLVNAVLRRIARERDTLLAALEDDVDPAAASLRHSMPLWIAELWWAQLGASSARALLARANDPGESALRANTLRTDAASLAASLPVATAVPGEPPEAVIALEPFDAHGSPQWRAGELMPQSRAAMLVAHALDPQPGERILDLCAAPGGKTTHIAALTGARGEVVAVERHAARAQALRRTAERMGADNVTVEVADATRPRRDGDRFARVLLDAPCSGLGTLQSRPDLRWRATPGSVRDLAEQQARLLSAAAVACAPGGILVYSTCTVSAAENEQQIGALLDAHPEFAAIDLQQRFPAWAHPGVPDHLLALGHVQGSDGFFIAALRRERD
jgi:16S rRNA (cytosine967-C5)-methyltransferase